MIYYYNDNNEKVAILEGWDDIESENYDPDLNSRGCQDEE